LQIPSIKNPAYRNLISKYSALTKFALTRRKFLKGGAGLAAAGGLGIAVDAAFMEPNHPRLERIEVRLPRLPAALDGFTVAQLSDFHYDPHFSITAIQSAVNMTNQLKADLVVLTGDFVTVPFLERLDGATRAADAIDPCARLLSAINSRHGLVAILGNHDVFADPDHVTRSLEVAGIKVLRNQCVPIEREGARFWLAGVDDVLGGGANVGETLRGVPGGEAVMLLCHEPDFADKVTRHPVDLQLSGHSHGGQVRLPLIGPLYLPELARKYPAGLRRIGSMMLYTNRGIGTIRLPVRWNCPPEVTLFTLRSALTLRRTP